VGTVAPRSTSIRVDQVSARRERARVACRVAAGATDSAVQQAICHPVVCYGRSSTRRGPSSASDGRSRAWVGPMAATCGGTFVGAGLTSIGYQRSRTSWSACNPTSS
jgi:hypothetical protein